MNKIDFPQLGIAKSSPRFATVSGEYVVMRAGIIRASEARNGRLVRKHIRFGLREVSPLNRDE
jgi:hypothetical protein